MFTPDSRYAGLATVATTTSGGKSVTALKLRRLPLTPGQPYAVKQNDQLDQMALDRYGHAGWYWYIADANSELEAARLLREPGRDILAPEK